MEHVELPLELIEYIINTIASKNNYSKLCQLSHWVRDIVIRKSVFESNDIIEWYHAMKFNYLSPSCSLNFMNVTLNINGNGGVEFTLRCFDNHPQSASISCDLQGHILDFQYYTYEPACVWTKRIVEYLAQLYPRLMEQVRIRTDIPCLCDGCSWNNYHWRGSLHYNGWVPTPNFQSIEIIKSIPGLIDGTAKGSVKCKVEFKLTRNIINAGYVIYSNGYWSNIFIPLDGERHYIYPSRDYPILGNYHWILSQMAESILPGSIIKKNDIVMIADLSDIPEDIIRELITQIMKLSGGYHAACQVSMLWKNTAQKILCDSICELFSDDIKTRAISYPMLAISKGLSSQSKHIYEVKFNQGGVSWDGMNDYHDPFYEGLTFNYQTDELSHEWLKKALGWITQLLPKHIVPHLDDDIISRYCVCKKCNIKTQLTVGYSTPVIESLKLISSFKTARPDNLTADMEKYEIKFTHRSNMVYVGNVMYGFDQKWGRIYNINNDINRYYPELDHDRTTHGNYQWKLSQLAGKKY